jgi:hypothetical protein
MTELLQPAIQPDHATHDATWMAALAARDPDLDPAEQARAQAALESCGACADLFADLVAMSAAIPSAAIPTRPRDFTLTAADAARLRPRGLRRWLAAIGSARDGITFPLAMGLTTMGIAGLLLATVPGAFHGQGGAAPMVLSTVGNAVPAAPAPAAASAAPAASAAAGAAPSEAPAASDSYEYGTMSAEPSQETAGEGVFSGDDGDAATASDRGGATTDLRQDASTGNDLIGLSALAIVAAVLLITGLGLFALRWNASRLNNRL